MSTEETQMGADGSVLLGLIKTELQSIPIKMWGCFYPCQVAVWRFIELRRPGVFDEIRTGFDTEPYFEGKGSKWFCQILFNKDEYITLLEEIMYPIVDQLKINPRAFERGFLYEEEVSYIDPDKTEQLALVVLAEVDDAIQKSLIS